MNNDDEIQDMGNHSHKPIRWKYKIAAVILIPLFIASFVFIFSLKTSIYSQPTRPDIRHALNKIVKLFTPRKESLYSPRVKMSPIESVIDTYLLNTGQYPSTLNDLVVDPGLPGWTGPYLKQSQLYDSWDNPFIYKLTSDGYQLISYGADGKPGGERYDADIYND